MCNYNNKIIINQPDICQDSCENYGALEIIVLQDFTIICMTKNNQDTNIRLLAQHNILTEHNVMVLL